MLLGGSSAFMLGSRITTVAFPLLILAISRSPLTAGWSTFAVVAPSALMYLPAGVLVDRWNPRRVMLASAVGRWAAIASIICVIALGEPSLSILTLAAATAQTLDVFFVLAERRSLRSLVGPEQATSALVRSEARTHLVVLVGRPLGALLVGLNWILPFAVDAFGSLMSMAALASIGGSLGKASVAADSQPTRSRERQTGATRGFLLLVPRMWRKRYGAGLTIGRLTGEFSDGLKWLRSNLFAAIGLGLTTGTTLVSQALIMIFFAEAYNQDHSATKIGLVLAASGAGGVVGSAAAARLFPRFGYPLLQQQMVMWCVIFFVLDRYGSQPYWLIACAMASLGFSGAIGNIAIDTFMILHAGKMLARVVSIDRLTSLVALALGPALGGALNATFGVQFALNVLFGITIALAVGSLFAAIARHFHRMRANLRRPMTGTTGDLVPNENGPGGRPSTRPSDARINDDLSPKIAMPGTWRRAKSTNMAKLVIRVVLTGPAYLLSAQELQEAKAK